MKSGVLFGSAIWGPKSAIWPEFPKSGILAQSAIWFLSFLIRGLSPQFQISGAAIRNLVRNRDSINKFNNLRQITDFGKCTPKGVGGLPRQEGGPPLTPGQSSRAEILARVQSDDGGRYRQASTTVVFHQINRSQKETTYG